MNISKLKVLEDFQKELKLVINPESNTKFYRTIKLLHGQLVKFKKQGEKRWRGFDIDFAIKYTEEKKFGKKAKVITGDIFDTTT